MAGSVGQVYYDVLPNLDGFAAKVASGLSAQKPIKIPVEVDSQKAAASLKQTTQATGNLTASSARLAAAQGRVRVSAAQLNEVRRTATAGSAKLVRAEEQYATALRGVQKARDQDAAGAARAAAIVQRSQERTAAAAAKAAAAQKAARAQTVQGIGSGLLVGGAATLAALGGITKVTADFDKAVSNVASTGKEASASIGALRAEAIKYGADTAFSATEAANAQAELIKANVSVTDTINGGLKGALDLAAAGSLDVANAAGIMGTTMSQFKIPGTDASHVADLLAAAAGKAQGEVTDFAEALKYVGPLAKSSGVSLEQTTGVLAEFANQGILGSQAGTALRGIFLGLTAPVGAGAKAIEKYGINVRDAQGNFIGLEGAAGELQKRLGGLTRSQRDAALAAIFGRNQVTAATILYEEGAKGVKTWSDAVNESGFAARTAATKMDNLAGDVEQLKGALDSAFIQSGGGGTSFLRGLAKDATSAIDGFNALPPAVQEGSFKLAAFAGATALAAGAGIKLLGFAASASTALATLGVSTTAASVGMGRLAAAAGPAGVALAAVAAGAIVFDTLGSKVKSADEMATGLDKIAQGSGNIADIYSGSNWADRLSNVLAGGVAPANNLSEAFKGLEVSQDNWIGNIAAWRETLTPGQQSLEQAKAKVESLDTALAKMVQEGNGEKAGTAIQNLGISSQQASRFLPEYQKALTAAGDAAASSFRQSEIAFKNGGAAAGGLKETGAAAQQSAEEIQELTAALYDNANAQLALSGNSIAVEAAMDAASKSFKDNGKTLDINTAKGRANQSALDNLVGATLKATAAMDEQGASAEDIAARNERAKASFIKNADAMGKTKGEATDLANALFVLPEQVTSQVVVSGAKVSRSEAKSLNRELATIPKSKRANIITIANTKGAKEAHREIAKVKSKSVIAKATGKGVNTVKEIDKSLKKLKSKGVRAEAKAAGKPAVDALDRSIKKLKERRIKAIAKAEGEAKVRSLNRMVAAGRSKSVSAKAVASGESGVRGINSAVNAMHDKTIHVRVKTMKANAGGGAIDPVRRAGGGAIRGYGGTKEDNIAGIDRATGVQTSWVSAREFVTNAAQYAKNKDAVEAINAGGTWDLVPRRAAGGPIGGSSSTSTGRGGRPLILNIDMGDLGIRRIVTEIVEDRDEYFATVGRMR